MADEKRVADYFVVAGLPDNPEVLEEYSEENTTKATHGQDPITDITVIIKSIGECCPEGFTCIEKTPSGLLADVNHGSIRSPEVYICYRRGRDRPPLVDIGVLYEGKEHLMSGCEVVHNTPYGRPANVNNTTSSRTFITYRRSNENAAPDTLAVTDICVVLTNKGENSPHAFCTISKNLNKGMVGSDVFLCYKKSMAKANTIAYKPGLLSQYPFVNKPKVPLPDSVPLFCLPMGAVIESWPTKAHHPKPVFSTFVLTGMYGEKMYGAAVTFYEKMSFESLSESQLTSLDINNESKNTKTVHCNRAICLLSRWPFFDVFKKYLAFLYRTAHTTNNAVSLERHISHFMWEVPFPSPQRPRILAQLNQESLTLSQPQDLPLPHSGASFIMLLKNLGADNSINLLVLALLEHKILIHSLRPAVLTSVAEALTAMLFPFHWQCPYVPLCPLGLCDVLSAPVPFIVGVDSRFFDMYDPPHDVVCIDLDTNTISQPDDKKTVNHKILPKKPLRVLKTALTRLFDRLPEALMSIHGDDASLTLTLEQDFKRKNIESAMEMAIQETFLRFMASILKGYKQYLLPITKAPTETSRATDASKLFDMQAFLRSREKTFHKFYIHLMRTQAFYRFIEERSFVSDNDACLAFFDECVEKVDESKDEPKLIEIEDSVNSERTVFISPPEPSGQIYNYNGFPLLNPDLFPVREIPREVLLSPNEKRPLCPNSPMARRTKFEVKSAQKTSQKHAETPQSWAKCLLSHCFSLWFIHLPAYVTCTKSKPKALRIAYDVLIKMQRSKLQQLDEVCYRVLMQLCCQYQQPILAIKVLCQMRRNDIQPNAITYGFYNKAVLESKWPSVTSNAILLWNKLRNVIMGVAQFRRAANLKISKLSMSLTSINNSTSDLDRISRNSIDFDALSRDSLDSFLDEQRRLESEKNKATEADVVTDLVKIDSPTLEERLSAGESDRGYNSLTHEESRQISSAIAKMAAQETQQTSTEPSHDATAEAQPELMTTPRKPSIKKDKKVYTPRGRSITFQAADIEDNDVFRNRIGSIVRKSVSSIGSQGSLRTLIGSQGLVGSSAGLLITASHVTQSHDDVFGGLTDIDLSNSLSAEDRNSEAKRRRHKSAGATTAGEYARRMVSSFWKPRYNANNVTPKTQLQKKTENGVAETDGVNSTETTGQVTGFEERLDSMELWDGIVNAEIVPSDLKSKESLSVNTESNGSKFGLEKIVEVSPNHDLCPNKRNRFSMEGVSNSAKRSSNDLDLNTSHDFEGRTTPTQESTRSDSRSSTSSQKSTPKKTTPKSTPLQTTPVTDNDPLGMFLSGLPQNANPVTTTTTNVDASMSNSKGSSNNLNNFDPSDLLTGANLFKSERSGSPNGVANDSIDGEISSSVIFKGESRTDITPLTLPNSITSNANNINSPKGINKQNKFEISLNCTNEEDTQINEARAAESPSNSLSRSISLNLQKAMSGGKPRAPSRGGSLPSGTNLSSPFGRFASRGSFKNALRSAASAVSTKFSAFKESMQAASASPVGSTASSLRGSQTSLQRSHDLDSLLLEEEEDNMAAKMASNRPNRADLDYDDGRLDVMSGRPVNFGDNVDRLAPLMDADASSYQSTQSLNLLNVSMEVEISSCTRCPKCHFILYDEQIMAGWSADDSNLNTACFFCSGTLVPFLQVYVKDYRCQQRAPADIKQSDDKENQSTAGLDSPSVVPSSPSSSTKSKSPRLSSTAELIKFSPASSPSQEMVGSFADIGSYSQDSSTSPTQDLFGPQGSFNNKGLISLVQAAERRCNIGEFHMNEGNQPAINDIADSSLNSTSDTSQSTTFDHSINNQEPISIPYLSPLVLRKELENVLDHEGDDTLTKSEFVDEHPIIYWNMVWYFKRLDVSSHLPGFALVSKSTNTLNNDSHYWTSIDSKHVNIKAMWDNIKFHKEVGLPMYISYFIPKQSEMVSALVTEKQPFSKGTMQNIVSSIQCNDIQSPFKIVIHERHTHSKGKIRGWYRSMYREILFLAFKVLGRENIDHDAFDREYKLAFRKLTPKDIRRLQKDDRPPSLATVWCRKVFGELDI